MTPDRRNHRGPRRDGGAPRYLEIRPDRPRRWRGLAAYVAFFAALCGAAAWLMTRFAVPPRLAVAIVLFMAVFMAATGWGAWRRMCRDEDRP